MSEPFSSAQLRIPRGFGTILNGLVREVLRDQPEDIPKYAAQYFKSLLKQRQESGVDPAEWAAGMEDRFYDNHAFKDTETLQDPTTEGTSGINMNTSKGKSNESKTGEKSSHSREDSSFSTLQQDVFEDTDLTGSTRGEKEEGKHDITERLTHSKGESLSRELDAEEPSGAVEQDPSTILDSANGKDISHHPDAEFTGISGFSDDVACASTPTAAEGEGTDGEEVLDKDMVDSNEKPEVEVEAEIFSHSGSPDLDVSAAKLEEKESTLERSAAIDDRQEGDEKSQHEDTSLPLPENLISESERPEDNQCKADDQAEATEEMERLQTSSEETHEGFSNIEDSNTQKGDSLVEVSFEDLPEAQEINGFEERQPEESDTAEAVQTNMELPPVEESKGIAAVAPDQNVSVTEDRSEREMVGVEMEVNSEEKEMESQQEASVMKERADTNDSNLSDEEDEMGQGDKVVSASDQPTGSLEKHNPEHESSHACESSLKISGGESQQKDPNSEEDISKHGCSKSGGDDQSPQATQSKSSTGALQTETETLQTGAQNLSEEDNRSQGTAAEAEPEVRVPEKDASESSELEEERKLDSESRDDDEMTFVKDSIGPAPPADEGEEGPLEKETGAGSEDSSAKKQEDCSRPQEEEDIMDIPLDDPEANRAAAKIQAGFRGHMTRKKLKPEDKAEGEERQEDRGQ